MTPPLLVQAVTHGGYNITVVPAGAHAAMHAAAQAMRPASTDARAASRHKATRRYAFILVLSFIRT